MLVHAPHLVSGSHLGHFLACRSLSLSSYKILSVCVCVQIFPFYKDAN
jgi:hypothetical protein